jgi:hypothetical protein
MIGGGSREGESKGDVHPLPECERLEDGHPDIVIGNGHRVDFPRSHPQEHRIGRERVGDLDAGSPKDFDRGAQDQFFLVSEEPAIRGMRIEST